MAGYTYSHNTPRAMAMPIILHGLSYASWGLANGKDPDWKRVYIPGVNQKMYTESFDPYTFSFSTYFNDPFLAHAAASYIQDPLKLGQVTSSAE
jgi:hypothetical protein